MAIQFKSGILFWIIIGVSLCLSAQTPEFDSLSKLLPQTKSRERVDLLNKIGESASHLGFEGQTEYYQQAIELSQKIRYYKGEADANYAFAMLLKKNNQFKQSNEKLEISKKRYADASYDKGVANSMISIGDNYSDLGNTQVALNIYMTVLTNKKFEDFIEVLAQGYNNIGLVYNNIGKNDSALIYFLKAQVFYKKVNNNTGLAYTYNNVGMMYGYSGDYDSSLYYFQLALSKFEKSGDIQMVISSYNNIGILFRIWEKYDQALIYQRKSLKLSIELNDSRLMANAYNSMGVIYDGLDSVEQQMEHYSKALLYYRKIGNKQGEERCLINIGNTYNKLKDYDAAIEHFHQAVEINNTTQNMLNRISEFNAIANNLLLQNKYQEASKQYSIALRLSKEAGLIEQQQTSISNIAQNYELWGKYDSALVFYRKFQELKDSIFTQTQLEQFAELDTKYNTEKKEAQIKLQKAELAKKTIENKRQKMLIFFFGVAFLLVVWLIVIVLRSLKQKQKDHEIIGAEKEKSEKLLLNILPSKIAEDLKKTGTTEPESFDHVTVFFSDIINFTKISEETEPEILIGKLNEIFTTFDDIMTKHNCERIKTIGDAFLAVSGMPVPDPAHVENMLDAALEVRDFMNDYNLNNELQFLIRMGINSGKAVGGVVGVRKYIYDVFGDAINTASRMESNSEAMMINVSETTMKLAKEKYVFEKREPISVKGKGVMEMYFLKEKIIVRNSGN